jgi:hypothetical protein
VRLVVTKKWYFPKKINEEKNMGNSGWNFMEHLIQTASCPKS